MNDYLIRQCLKNNLIQLHANEKDTLIIEELGLKHGVSRIDLAVVNGTLHGYEIKSDEDTLNRLPTQSMTYNLIFDYVTLVVGYRHAYSALNLIPEWWGIQIVESNDTNELSIYTLREASQNPTRDIYSIVKLLWRDEAINLLDKISSADGVRSKPRKSIYEKLILAAEENTICELVRNQLKSRRDWRVPALQGSCDD